MADCKCYTCVTSECDKDCCSRCIAFGIEVAMDDEKQRNGFHEGSQFVDYAYRDGKISGLDMAYTILKARKSKRNRTPLEREVVAGLMDELLNYIALTVNHYNEWLQEEDSKNRTIESIWLGKHG